MNIKYHDDKCLALWREASRLLWQNRCAYHSVAGGKCGFIDERQKLECHHIIPRSNKLFRFDPINSFLCCPLYHDHLEQHKDEFDAFLKENWPITFAWVDANKGMMLQTPMWEVHYRMKAEELKAIIKNLTPHPVPSH